MSTATRAHAHGRGCRRRASAPHLHPRRINAKHVQHRPTPEHTTRAHRTRAHAHGRGCRRRASAPHLHPRRIDAKHVQHRPTRAHASGCAPQTHRLNAKRAHPRPGETACRRETSRCATATLLRQTPHRRETRAPPATPRQTPHTCETGATRHPRGDAGPTHNRPMPHRELPRGTRTPPPPMGHATQPTRIRVYAAKRSTTDPTTASHMARPEPLDRRCATPRNPPEFASMRPRDQPPTQPPQATWRDQNPSTPTRHATQPTRIRVYAAENQPPNPPYGRPIQPPQTHGETRTPPPSMRHATQPTRIRAYAAKNQPPEPPKADRQHTPGSSGQDARPNATSPAGRRSDGTGGACQRTRSQPISSGAGTVGSGVTSAACSAPIDASHLAGSCSSPSDE